MILMGLTVDIDHIRQIITDIINHMKLIVGASTKINTSPTFNWEVDQFGSEE